MTSQVENIPKSSVLFARGVIARLIIWPILRIAVQEGWGGPNGGKKRTWIASEIVDAFETQKPPPDDQYIEELLLQIMQDEFETNIEDGSTESVGVDIVRMWDETRVGKLDLVLKFEELADKLKGKEIQVPVVGNDDEEWSDEDEDSVDEDVQVPSAMLRTSQTQLPTRSAPEVDESGFTLVKRGRGR